MTSLVSPGVPTADNLTGTNRLKVLIIVRFPGGAARGDYKVINTVRNLFFTI